MHTREGRWNAFESEKEASGEQATNDAKESEEEASKGM